jgi:hypothetical protein
LRPSKAKFSINSITLIRSTSTPSGGEFASTRKKAYDPAGERAGRIDMSEEREDFSSTSTFSRVTQFAMLIATAAICGGVLAAIFAE